VLGGREKEKIGRSYKAKKKKAITAVELTEDGKVKMRYAMYRGLLGHVPAIYLC